MDGPRTVGRATSDMAEPGPTVIEAPLSPPGSVDPGFCGGGPVPISPRFTRRAKIIAVASLCAVIAALGLSSASIDQARNEEHSTTASLARTSAVLRGTDATLRRTQAALAVMTLDNHNSQAALEKRQSQLAAVRTQLSSDQKNLFVQGVSISDVDTCLGGVEAALNEIAVNDPSGAATSLGQVSQSCQRAEASGG